MKARKHNGDFQQPAKQGDHEEAPGESCLYVNWIWNIPWHSWDWHCHRAISCVWFCDCGNGKCILAIGYGILWEGTKAATIFDILCDTWNEPVGSGNLEKTTPLKVVGNVQSCYATELEINFTSFLKFFFLLKSSFNKSFTTKFKNNAFLSEFTFFSIMNTTVTIIPA